MSSDVPTLRWGIIATGLMSSWFVEDLSIDRKDAKAKHVIQAVGSSSLGKGKAFVSRHLPGQFPSVYGTYEEVYSDPDVDIIYIGTPHAFHKQNCLDAISHNKHVMCEKTFTLNAKEAHEVFAAAKAKGVFVMEAMWTRFLPLVRTIQSLLHTEKVIGNIHRVFCDYGKIQDISSLGSDSRLKNLALGAGTLLDIGIYSLTWTLLALHPGVGEQAEIPQVSARQTLDDGVDVASSIILFYQDGRQGVATSSSVVKTAPTFCRIEGTKGFIVVEGPKSSAPTSFTLYSGTTSEQNGQKYVFERVGHGFYFEADAVALDIAAGRVENSIMPWAETIRVLDILDEIRHQGGARFPQETD